MWRVFICVFNEACLSATVDMMVVMCSSRTENDSSSVLREDMFVTLEVVTILCICSSLESTGVKSCARLEVVDVASES